MGQAVIGIWLATVIAGCAGTQPTPGQSSSAAQPTAAQTTARPTPATSPATSPGLASPSPAAAPTPAPSPKQLTAASMEPLPPLEQLWTYRGDPSSPTWAPAIDAQGHIWVAAFQLDQFWVLDRDGKRLETWGTSGAGDGQLSFKGDAGFAFGSIAFTPDGGFLVGDMRNHRIQRFAKDRSFVSKFGTFGSDDGQFVTITGLALGQGGEILVDDNDRLDVQEFDPTGAYVRTMCPKHSGPLIASDANGAVYCLDDGRLDKVGADGTSIWSLDASAYVTLGIGVAVAPNAHVFVASVDPDAPPATAPQRLLEIDSDGNLLRVWPTGGEGIAIDPKGNRIYIASADLAKVTAYALPTD
jgi:DNA-binding beta-propeller fold protein YncE